MLIACWPLFFERPGIVLRKPHSTSWIETAAYGEGVWSARQPVTAIAHEVLRFALGILLARSPPPGAFSGCAETVDEANPPVAGGSARLHALSERPGRRVAAISEKGNLLVIDTGG